MDASITASNRRRRPRRSVVVSTGTVLASTVFACSAAGATGRSAIATTGTTPKSGAALIILGAAVLVLGGVGFFVFSWTRRKRRPNVCAEQREALELAERAVRYWEAARAHLEAVERERTLVDAPDQEPGHASLVAKAAEGLNNAMKQRDQCQMDLIRCMASGVPAPVTTTNPFEGHPLNDPGADGRPSEWPFPTDR